MRQKMINPYLLRNCFWILRQIFLDEVAEGQSPLFSKLRNGNPGKHLVHGGDIKFGIDPIGNIENLARQAISLLEEWRSISGNKYHTGEPVICNELFQKSCEA